MLDFRLVILNMGRGPRTGSSLARHGFTLVEMMVVLAILMVLGAMTVAILPSVTEGQYTIQAATQLQQWFEIAKQNAARDRAPRGVRLMPNPDNPKQILSLEFLGQPPPFTLGDRPSGSPTTATCNGSDLVTFSSDATRGFTFLGAAPQLQPVQPGDYLELAGLIYKIQAVDGPRTLRLFAGAAAFPHVTTSQYRVLQKPRPMGDEPLEMPKNTAIDLTNRPGTGDARWLPPVPIQGAVSVDIMFGPDGRVLGSMAAREKIIFWVRDVTLPEPNGDPTLVVIYPATGLIATHPVDIGFFQGEPVTPYTFTSTGKRSSH